MIDVQKSKNVASHRFVRIPDNLLAWLKPYANKKGQVSIRNDAFFRRMRATRAGAVTALEERGIAADNLRDWPSDCLRHTFASCHYAAFKNAGDSAEQLGHGGDLTISFRHYRGRIREPEAREYWEIYPRSPQPFSVVAA